MTDRKKKDEADRRLHARFKVKSGTTIKAKSQSADIIDISMGGLSFSYIDDNEWTDESFERGMLLGEKDLCLEDIPMKIISDCAINSGLSVTRRCGVKFEKLSPKQLAQLEYYIWANTDATEVETKRDDDDSS